MAINWFEGGRRISKLCMGIVIAVGAATVLWRDDPDPVLSIRGPTMPWFVSPDTCPENAYVRYLWDYDWGGENPGLRLCYLPLADGSIPYAIAPTPPEALEKQAQEKRENERRMAKGEPPTLTINSPWFYGAPEYDEKVQTYVSESVASLRITPELATRLSDSLSSVRWEDRKKAFNEALPWVAGICGFLWAFTFAMGWIVRGFTGIPTGQDFKPVKAKEESS